MRDQGLGSWPARRARAAPDRIALCFGDSSLTFGQLAGHVEQLAHALATAGIAPGDRVAYLGGNQPEMLELMFAAMHLGAMIVPMNMRLAAAEIAYQLSDCGATLLVTDAERHAVGSRAVELAHTPLTWTTEQLCAARDAADATPVDRRVQLAEPALILYTSGTTGAPKGVVLTHSNLTFNSMNVLIELDLAADEVALITTPLFHAAALSMNALPLLAKGATLVLARSARPEELVALIARHGVTHVQGVPTIHQALVDSPAWRTADHSRLRRVVSGGAAASGSLIAAFAEANVLFCQGYGMTETGPGALFLTPESSACKPGSVGRAMFFTDVRLADETGAAVPAPSVGEVLVSGPNVMAGYWNRPEATAAAFHDGEWYRSGDVGRFDDDGDGYIIDRLKDMYVSGGENVYPAEVEAVLNAHPDVAESAVFGVPDERWGEVGRAAVVLRDGATLDGRDLIEYVRAEVAHYKAPRSAVVVDALPRNAAGKITKSVLADSLAHAADGASPGRT